MSNFDGGPWRGRVDGGQKRHREIIVCRLITGLILSQRDSVEVAKEIIEVLGTLLVVQPVSLVRREHRLEGVLVGEGLQCMCTWVGVINRLHL